MSTCLFIPSPKSSMHKLELGPASHAELPPWALWGENTAAMLVSLLLSSFNLGLENQGLCMSVVPSWVAHSQRVEMANHHGCAGNAFGIYPKTGWRTASIILMIGSQFSHTELALLQSYAHKCRMWQDACLWFLATAKLQGWIAPTWALDLRKSISELSWSQKSSEKQVQVHLPYRSPSGSLHAFRKSPLHQQCSLLVQLGLALAEGALEACPCIDYAHD